MTLFRLLKDVPANAKSIIRQPLIFFIVIRLAQTDWIVFVKNVIKLNPEKGREEEGIYQKKGGKCEILV